MTDLPTAVLLLGRPGAAGAERYRRAAAARDFAILVIDEPSTDTYDEWTVAVETAVLAPIQVTEIVDQTATWSGRYDIRAVCPLTSPYGDAGALVADLLGRPGPGLRAAAAGRSPDLRRSYLPEWSAAADRVPPNRRAAIVSGWTAFPATVRPASQAAGGTSAADPAELATVIRAHTPSERLLIEAEPRGRAYSVESLSRDGRMRRIRITTQPAHTPPGVTDRDRERLTEAHALILTRLAFDTGAVHAVYHLDGDRTPVLTAIGVGPSPETEDETIEDAIIEFCTPTAGAPIYC